MYRAIPTPVGPTFSLGSIGRTQLILCEDGLTVLFKGKQLSKAFAISAPKLKPLTNRQKSVNSGTALPPQLQIVPNNAVVIRNALLGVESNKDSRTLFRLTKHDTKLGGLVRPSITCPIAPTHSAASKSVLGMPMWTSKFTGLSSQVFTTSNGRICVAPGCSDTYIGITTFPFEVNLVSPPAIEKRGVTRDESA